MQPRFTRFLAGGLVSLASLLASHVYATDSTVSQLDEIVSPIGVSPDLIQTRQLHQDSQTTAQRPKATVLELPMLADQKAGLLQSNNSLQPIQIGVGRAVTQAENSADMAALLAWSTASDGTTRAAISVRSPGARGMRLALQVEFLPPGTLLRTYGAESTETTEISGAEVLRTIQQNMDAGTPDTEARTYWLPSVEGEEGVLEIELPPGVDPHLLKIALPQLSHLVMLVTDERAWARSVGDGDYCNVDLMCSARKDQAESKAVAHMQFVSNGGTYICTGTLMNNTRQDLTPYFLSANHCFSTQSEASSLVTYWDFRSSSCNSGQVYSGYQKVIGGARLLHASSDTDVAFMQLNGALPAGRVFAGWDASPASVSGSVYGIHHPKGDLQKVSEGSLDRFFKCNPVGGSGTFSCTGATNTTGQYVNVVWNTGTTEGGSSGSALFNASGRIIGQLYGGSSSCTNFFGSNVYGRFDLSFNSALNKWLAPTSIPTPIKRSAVYRFYNTTTEAHFYTNNEVERDGIIENYKQFRYEGPAFYAPSTAEGGGLSPVYRFYNHVAGVHFYTINQTERDSVIANLPQFNYEGPTWYAQQNIGNGASAVYRFYNTRKNIHFYTINESERDSILATLPHYRYEGISYYAWNTP